MFSEVNRVFVQVDPVSRRSSESVSIPVSRPTIGAGQRPFRGPLSCSFDAPEHVKAPWMQRKVELLAAVEAVEAQR